MHKTLSERRVLAPRSGDKPTILVQRKGKPVVDKLIRHTLIDAYFGEFGGQYVPDELLPVLDQLEKAYVEALADPTFEEELDELRRHYLGRPTPITECENLPLPGVRGGARPEFSSSGRIWCMVGPIRETRCWLGR